MILRFLAQHLRLRRCGPAVYPTRQRLSERSNSFLISLDKLIPEVVPYLGKATNAILHFVRIRNVSETVVFISGLMDTTSYGVGIRVCFSGILSLTQDLLILFK
jgi:hypothetical protein